jgi:hypothetical protein
VLLGATLTAVLIGWRAYAFQVGERYFLNPDPSERQLLAFLETLPQDTLLAGSPSALDNVPLFAKRDVLFSFEKPGFDNQIIFEALDSYYAQEEKPLLDFCDAHRINHLVIDRRAYSDAFLADEKIFFEPYDALLRPIIAGRDHFVVQSIPKSRYLFHAGDFFVVPCRGETFAE